MRWLWVLLPALTMSVAWAGDARMPLLLDGSASSVALAGRSMAWVDTSGTMGVETVEALAAELPFEPRGAAHRVTLGTQAALWIRFDAWAQDTSTHWELEMARAGTDRISLFHRRADGS